MARTVPANPALSQLQCLAKPLTGDGGEQIFVPPGFAHGFCTLEQDTEVAYKVDSFYAPSCAAGGLGRSRLGDRVAGPSH